VNSPEFLLWQLFTINLVLKPSPSPTLIRFTRVKMFPGKPY
jgi:hypothetical protein